MHACDCILHARVAGDVKEDSVYELELRPDVKKVQA